MLPAFCANSNASRLITSAFDFNSAVTDVAINDEFVAVLSPTECYIYDLNGNLKNSLTCEYKGVFVGLSSDDNVLVLDNSKLINVN